MNEIIKNKTENINRRGGIFYPTNNNNTAFIPIKKAHNKMWYKIFKVQVKLRVCP